MERAKVVVDASIVVKWFISEAYSSEAIRLRDAFATGRIRIVIPPLLFYEVLNAIMESKLYNEDEVADIAKALAIYGFDVELPSGRLLEDTARVGVRHDITIYDAAYIALATHQKASLCTADEILLKKFPVKAIHIREFEKKL